MHARLGQKETELHCYEITIKIAMTFDTTWNNTTFLFRHKLKFAHKTEWETICMNANLGAELNMH